MKGAREGAHGWGETARFLARRRVPQSGPMAPDENARSIGGKGDGINPARMAAEPAKLLAAVRVQEIGCVVAETYQCEPAVARQGNGPDRILLSERTVRAGVQIPDSRR